MDIKIRTNKKKMYNILKAEIFLPKIEDKGVTKEALALMMFSRDYFCTFSKKDIMTRKQYPTRYSVDELHIITDYLCFLKFNKFLPF